MYRISTALAGLGALRAATAAKAPRMLGLLPPARRLSALWRSSSTSGLGLGARMPVTAVPRTLVRMPARTYAGAAGSPGARGGINGLLREYGAVALGVYFSMSFLVFCCCFASITFLGINETHIARVFAQLKRLVGLGTKPDGEAPVSAGGRDSAEEASSAASSSAEREQAERKSVLDWLPEWARNPTVVRIGTNALLAMAMTKLFVPIKVAITAAIVPSVAKRLRAMGFNIGTSGVAGAVREARDRIKNS